MDSERISLSVENGIAQIRLNRPEKLNALDFAMFEAMMGAYDRLSSISDLRVVVLDGVGKSFCVGIDLDFLRSGGTGPLSDLETRSYGHSNQFQRAVLQWRELAVPVIAAVHGYALGGGFQIMLGADVRIISPTAILGVKEVRWGLVPDMAGFALMRKLARDDIVRELVFSAREFSGTDALDYGFATRLAESPREEALSLARHIATFSPAAVRAAKRLLNLASGPSSMDAVLCAESHEQQQLLGSAEQREALAAGIARRHPRSEN